MGVPKASYIANLVVSNGSNIEYQNLKDVAATILQAAAPSYSTEQVQEIAESQNTYIANYLFLKKDECLNDGYSINFEITQDGSDYYIKFLDRPEIALLRKLHSKTTEYFEQFCTRILNTLGGNAFVTGGKTDGGIDFYASDLKLSSIPGTSTKGSRILLVGQAKRHNDHNQVTETDLRAFIGAAMKKIDEFKKTRSEQYGILHPTMLAYWTTSDFQADAKKYANDFGIWYLNGPAICQLALQLGIDVE